MESLELAGHRFAISDLTLTECLTPIIGLSAGRRLPDFWRFFHGPNLQTLTISSSAFLRASSIRGRHLYPSPAGAMATRIGLADALHLAVAIESGCDRILTNDRRLASFADIQVELLP